MSNYDLSSFVKEQNKKKGYVTLCDDHRYEIKCNAWSFLKLQSINEKHKGQDAIIGQKVVEEFLGKKALKFVEDNMPVAGREQVIAIIVAHVMEIDMSKPSKKTAKK